MITESEAIKDAARVQYHNHEKMWSVELICQEENYYSFHRFCAGSFKLFLQHFPLLWVYESREQRNRIFYLAEMFLTPFTIPLFKVNLQASETVKVCAMTVSSHVKGKQNQLHCMEFSFKR